MTPELTNLNGLRAIIRAIIFKIFVFIIISICAIILIQIMWRNGVFLPRWIEWQNKEFYGNSSQYNITYEIKLKNKSVNITHDGEEIWSSPPDIKVQNALSFDIDNDNEDELILLCWKIGKYGSSRPLWVQNDETKWSQHIFTYEYGCDGVHPKWMSSYIGQDVVSMSANGRESPFSRLLLTDTEQNISCWVWDSWGFSKENADITFVVFGDNLIHEPIFRYGLLYDETFSFLFENVRSCILDSSVAVINQETPFVDDSTRYSGYPRFATPLNVGRAIADAGFDVVTCATNHALDMGSVGIDTTKEFFDSNGIICLGIQSSDDTDYKPYDIIVRKGIRFAMLNYTYGTNGIKCPEEYPDMVHLLDDEDKIRNDIETAKADSDFVILFAHWGTENSTQTDEFQREWTNVFLESGVDVVVGTHPHTIQPYEILRDEDGHEMLVYYSIGNFISAQNEQYCVKGGMAEFTFSPSFDGYELSTYSLEPLSISADTKGRYTVDRGCLNIIKKGYEYE